MKALLLEDVVDLLRELASTLQDLGPVMRGSASQAEPEQRIGNPHRGLPALDLSLNGADRLMIAQRLHAMMAILERIQLRLRGANEIAGAADQDAHTDAPLLALGRPPHTFTAAAAVAVPPGHWALNSVQRRIVSPIGQATTLTDSEHQFLLTLVAAGGRPVARHLLLEVLGRTDCKAGQRALDVKVCRLRKKLRDINAGEAPLRSERGAGYRFADRCQMIPL